MARWIRPPIPQRINTEGGKYFFDEAAAKHAAMFFENWLTHTMGEWAGQPFRLADWQYHEVIAPLFGWKERKTGLRRFRRAYIEVPKKNGKSAIASGVGLYLTGADDEQGAHVYSAATSEDQARVVFDEARNLVNASERLRAFYEVTRSQISVPMSRSFYRVLSKIAESKHGINASGVIFDELHALKRPELYNVLTQGSGAARRQPVQFTITTAGTDKTSVGWKEHQHALNVLSGAVKDDKLLVVIYAAKETDDWTSPKTWRKCNPGLGITLKEESIADACERAKAQPYLQNLFKQLHLNIWSSVSSRWLSIASWNACRGEVSAESLRGMPCWGGLDLSTTKDITALVWLFAMGDRLVLLPQFFMPRGNIEGREKMDAVRYSSWIANGFITATEGDRVDYGVVRAKILEGKQLFDVQEIGYDTWNATEIVNRLTDDKVKMVPVKQGYQLSPASKEFERLVAAGMITHPGNPVLDWMAANVEVITSAQENIMLVKPFAQDSATQRIDGIVASVMAMERYTRRGSSSKSVYESRGVQVI